MLGSVPSAILGIYWGSWNVLSWMDTGVYQVVFSEREFGEKLFSFSKDQYIFIRAQHTVLPWTTKTKYNTLTSLKNRNLLAHTFRVIQDQGTSMVVSRETSCFVLAWWGGKRETEHALVSLLMRA